METTNFNVPKEIIFINKKNKNKKNVPERHYISLQLSIDSLDFRFQSKHTNNYSPNTNLVDKKIRGDSILEQLPRQGMLYYDSPLSLFS